MHSQRTAPAPLPSDLPRLLMRRSLAVVALVLAGALGLGLMRMASDIDDEFAAADTLAGVLASLAPLAAADDAQAAGSLAALQADLARHPTHHLQLWVHAADGRPLLQPAAGMPDAWPLRTLLALHRAWARPAVARKLSWPMARPDGRPWTVTLAASPESERREALLNLAGSLSMILVCTAGLLLVMRWNLRHALAPLDRLLAVIRSDQGLDTQALQALPPMPVQELAHIAQGLQRLARALEEAETRRRLLSQQVLSLQEDERAHLAAELHDEFGQRLTALRVDIAWLSRRLAGHEAMGPVVAGMADQCEFIQQDIRTMLARLQPFGPASDPARADGERGQPLSRLLALLQALVRAWTPSGKAAAAQCSLDFVWADHGKRPPAPEQPGGMAAAAHPDVCLPQALALALFRISQEALTNVARHAGAAHAVLALHLSGAGEPGAALRVVWSVQDDGCGMGPQAALQPRGNGLSGMRERVWAQGGELQVSAGLRGLGLGLRAQFDTVVGVPYPGDAGPMAVEAPAYPGAA